MGELYKLTSPSGKSYIGITSQTATKRWWKHKNNALHNRCVRAGSECLALYDAVRKYGSSNFKLETLVIANFDYLKQLETKVIALFNTKVPYGYNLTDGGEGALGAVPTQQTRQKMALAQRKRLADPQQAAVVKAAIAKASATKAAKWAALTEAERVVRRGEHAAKLAKIERFTPEVRAKMSAAQKARTHTKWTEERKSNAVESGAYKWSDEKKAMASAKRKQEWADPVLRQKRLDGFKKARDLRNKEQQ